MSSNGTVRWSRKTDISDKKPSPSADESSNLSATSEKRSRESTPKPLKKVLVPPPSPGNIYNSDSEYDFDLEIKFASDSGHHPTMDGGSTVKNKDLSQSGMSDASADCKKDLSDKCLPYMGKVVVNEMVLVKKTELREGEKLHQCPECPSAFKKSSNLTRHMRSHTGESPYHCTECPARFRNTSNLKAHMRIHTGEKPYLCSECSKSFARACDLKKHIVIHTGEKPYQCLDCDASFTVLSNLRRHMKIHTGKWNLYQCQECTQAFTHAYNLENHERNHTLEHSEQSSEFGPSEFQPHGNESPGRDSDFTGYMPPSPSDNTSDSEYRFPEHLNIPPLKRTKGQSPRHQTSVEQSPKSSKSMVKTKSKSPKRKPSS